MNITRNLSISSAYFNSAGQLICTVFSCDPLFIKELIIVPYPNLVPTPVGILKPDTSGNGAVRQIYADSRDGVFNTPAPFTLAVTFDDHTYKLATIQVLLGPVVQAVVQLFDFSPAANLTPDEAAIFVTQAVAAVAPQFELAQGGLAARDVAAKAEHDKSRSHGHKNGHDKHDPC